MRPRNRFQCPLTPLVLIVLSLLSPKICVVLSSESSNKPTPPSTPTSAFDPEPPFRYVSGVYPIPESPTALPVIYDSYFPLIFELNLPQWDIHSMKIQFWKDHNNCTESDTFSEGYPCPVMYHSNKWIEYFVGNMTLWKNLFLDDPLSVEEHPEVLGQNLDLDLPLLFSSNHSAILDQEYYCSKIVNHFSTFQTSREQVNGYLRLLDKCENEPVLLQKNLSASAPFLESLYHATFSSFVSDYWDRLPTMIAKQSAMVNLYTSLESSLLLHQFMESQKWSQTISSCQEGQIPWSLLDHDEIFNGIRSHVHLFEHQLAIPLSEMSKYYKLPLTDCVFIGRDSLLVRILVPIRTHAKDPGRRDDETTNSYKLIKFEPIIFHEDSQFCWIEGIRNKRFISDGVHPGNLHETECSDQEQKLCRVPVHHFSSHDAAGPCAQALYTNSEPAILESCPLKCVSVRERAYNYKYFNFAHTYDDNFIYAVADDDASIEISCKGRSNPLTIRRLTYGAWNLTLPCGCDITGGGTGSPKINFEIAPPCQSQFIVERIRPYHWRNVENKARKKNPVADANILSNAKSQDELVAMLDQRYGSYYYVTLWLVILILSVALGVMTYFMVQLLRWKAHEQFKESRLIYSNVMSSREDFPMEGQQNNVNPRY